MKTLLSFFALVIISVSKIYSQDTINVNPGWNMIGTISTRTINEIRSEPPGIITSVFYGYSTGGYSTKDTLIKGRGYWVKANQSGLILSVNQAPNVPSTPFPNDNDTGVSTTMKLSWSCNDPDSDPLTYDVYFGTDNPPTTIISSNQGDTSISRDNLSNSTMYYWKVLAKDTYGYTSTSGVWKFTTSAPANQPPVQASNLYPADGEVGVLPSVTLTWSCTDPEADPLTYDVYFGTDNPPATKVSSDQTETNFIQSGLSNGVIYYWKVIAKDNQGNFTEGEVWSFTTAGPCPGIPTVTYEGKTYNTIQIGTHCWLKENLDVGTRINGTANQTNNSTIEKYCYNNDPAQCNTYGGLYQWNEAMQYGTIPGAQGICPTGWHIPTLAELQTLSSTVNYDANSLKAIGQGTGGGAGTNTSGFSALFSGNRYFDGGFYNIGEYTYFWSSTENGATNGTILSLTNFDSNTYFHYWRKDIGYCIRCIKD
ncbi:MAG: hypothetical protein HYZ34_12060 [Ignavibacteriae bacterium]|nr:hypothetical protein [Ignavibacteriota bacterium]